MEVSKIGSFGSKFLGWLAAVVIVLVASWFLLPTGYNTLVLWLAPQLGNYIRPTFVLVNALLVDPLNNLQMVAIWGVAGFIAGVLAGTKKGAFAVGFMAWLTMVLILVFFIFQLFTTGIELGTIPPIPPGTSIADVLGIPLIQSVVDQLLPLIGGFTGGSPDITQILQSVVLWIVTPPIVVIVTGIIGATVRPKE